jgi:hypothetical protein
VFSSTISNYQNLYKLNYSRTCSTLMGLSKCVWVIGHSNYWYIPSLLQTYHLNITNIVFNLKKCIFLTFSKKYKDFEHLCNTANKMVIKRFFLIIQNLRILMLWSQKVIHMFRSQKVIHMFWSQKGILMFWLQKGILMFWLQKGIHIF